MRDAAFTMVSEGHAVDLSAVVAGNIGFSVVNTGTATTITGSGLADTLVGGAADDTLTAGAGDDRLTGDAGSDAFVVTTGSARITDLTAEDRLVVASGASVTARVDGGYQATAGHLTLDGALTLETASGPIDLSALTQADGTGSVTVLVDSSAGSAKVTGSALNDLLSGGGGDDLLQGGDGDDLLVAGLGHDTLTGGAGADVFDVSQPGSGTTRVTDLGDGQDDLRALRDANIEAVVVDGWTASPLTYNHNGAVSLFSEGHAVDLSDVRYGNAGFRLVSVGDATALTGSRWSDTLVAGTGEDTLAGGAGGDLFRLVLGSGFAGPATVTDLGLGADIVQVDSTAPDGNAVSLRASVVSPWTASADTFNRSGHVEIATPGHAVDLSAVTGGARGFAVTNGGAATTLAGSAHEDTLVGGAGDDTLQGGGGDDLVTGGAGADLFVVSAGRDRITDLGRGADRLRVDAGATVEATLVAPWAPTAAQAAVQGAVHLRSPGQRIDLSALTTGAWRLSSTEGASALTGSSRADTLEGADGDDTLAGGAGDDLLTGGAGADTFDVTAGHDTLTDLGRGADMLKVAAGASVDALLHAAWTPSAAQAGIEGTAQIWTSGFAVDVSAVARNGAGLWIANTGAGTSLKGTSADDTLIGHAGDDTLVGGAGRDLLRSGGGNDQMTGGAGDDTLHVTDAATPGAGGVATVVDLGNGRDVLVVETSMPGTVVSASVVGAWTATSASANTGGQVELTTPGLSVDLSAVTAGTTGFVIRNTGGAAAMAGSAWADTLIGGAVADTLAGGGGDDLLTGGSGHDVFLFGTGASGRDTIVDFGLGDRLQFTGAAFQGQPTEGDGKAVGRNALQILGGSDSTTLFVGLDDTPGADLVIVLAGEVSGVRFAFKGNDIVASSAPSVAAVDGPGGSDGALVAAQTYVEDTARPLPALRVADGDSATATVTMTLSNAQAGRLSTATAGAVTSTFDVPSGTWRASGPVADLNGLLAALTFVPAQDFELDFGIDVRVVDDSGLAGGGSIAFVAQPVNDPPAGSDARVTLAEDTARTLGIADFGAYTDVEGTPLQQIRIAGPATQGRLQRADGQGGWSDVTQAVELSADELELGRLRFVPEADRQGTPYATLSFAVGDGQAFSAAHTLTLDVTPVDDAPVAADSQASGPEDTELTGTVQAADVDGDALSYTIVAGPLHGTLQLQPDGRYRYTPKADFHGSDRFTFQASDGTLASEPAEVALTITPVNDAPTLAAALPALRAVVGSAFAGTLPAGAFADVDGDGLGYAATLTDGRPLPAWLVFDGATGSWSGTPALQDEGTLAIVVTATDPSGASASGPLDMAVVVNNPPAMKLSPVRNPTRESEYNGDRFNADAFTFAVEGKLASAADADWYAVVLGAPGSQKVTFDASGAGGSWSLTWYDPALQVIASRTLGAGLSSFDVPAVASGTYYARVQAATPATYRGDAYLLVLAAAEDYTYVDTAGPDAFGLKTGALNGSDADAGTLLRYGLQGGTEDPQGLVRLAGPYGTMLLDPDTGTFDFTPDDAAVEALRAAQSQTFTFSVDDGHAVTTTTLTLRFVGTNDTPSAEPEARSTLEDEPLTGRLTATDAEGDELTYSIVQPPSHGELQIEGDGRYVYTPAPDHVGGDSFEFEARDPDGARSTAVVTIAIDAVNDAPRAADAAFFTTPGSTLQGRLPPAFDVEGDPVSYAIHAKALAASRGRVEVDADGSFSYQAADGVASPDSFAFTVSDDRGGTTTHVVDLFPTGWLALARMANAWFNGTLGAETMQVLQGVLDSFFFGDPALLAAEIYVQYGSPFATTTLGQSVANNLLGADGMGVAGSANELLARRLADALEAVTDPNPARVPYLRGQVLLAETERFTTLVDDPVYGDAARRFNAEIDAALRYARVAGTLNVPTNADGSPVIWQTDPAAGSRVKGLGLTAHGHEDESEPYGAGDVATTADPQRLGDPGPSGGADAVAALQAVAFPDGVTPSITPESCRCRIELVGVDGIAGLAADAWSAWMP